MHDYDEDNEFISKTQRKRECHTLQELGEALIALSRNSLEQIPLNDDLKNAILEAHRIKQRGAMKRQRQYIGRLMRDADSDAIQQAYDRITSPHQVDVQQLHKIERWRDRLIEQGDDALGELLNDYPHADRQHLRQLSRTASREQEQHKAPKAAREIFQYLKGLFAAD